MNKIIKVPTRLGISSYIWTQKTKNLVISKYSTSNTTEEYETIYKFPYIRALSIFNRLKLFQTSLTCALFPFSGLLYSVNAVGIDVVKTIGIVGRLIQI